MLRVFIIFGIIFSLSLITASESKAGAMTCDSQNCQNEEGCNAINFCNVEGDSLDMPCTWCGTFCADSCPEPEGPAVIVPTMGQWAMVLTAMILGLFAILRLTSIKDLELQ